MVLRANRKWKYIYSSVSKKSHSSVGKESACSARVHLYAGDPGSIPGLGRSWGEGNTNPLQYSCLGNSMDRGAWRATVNGVTRVRPNLVTKRPRKVGGKIIVCDIRTTIAPFLPTPSFPVGNFSFCISVLLLLKDIPIHFFTTEIGYNVWCYSLILLGIMD